MKKGVLIVRPLPPPAAGQPIRAMPEWRRGDTIYWALIMTLLILALVALAIMVIGAC